MSAKTMDMCKKQRSMFFEASFVLGRHEGMLLLRGSRKRPLCETNKGSDNMFKSMC